MGDNGLLLPSGRGGGAAATAALAAGATETPGSATTADDGRG
jgi:hypothetical protein